MHRKSLLVIIALSTLNIPFDAQTTFFITLSIFQSKNFNKCQQKYMNDMKKW